MQALINIIWSQEPTSPYVSIEIRQNAFSMPRGTYKASPTFRSHVFQEDQCLLLALHGNNHMWWTLGLKIRTEIQYHKHAAQVNITQTREKSSI